MSEKPEPFVMVPKWLFDIGLSPSAIAVYAALRFYRNDQNGRCDPSYTSVGSKVGLSHDRTEKYVKELERARAVRIIRALGKPNQHEFPSADTLRVNAYGHTPDPTHDPTRNPTHIRVTNENNENNEVTYPLLECSRKLKELQKAKRRKGAPLPPPYQTRRSQVSLKNARLDVPYVSFSEDGKEVPSSIETESQGDQK